MSLKDNLKNSMPRLAYICLVTIILIVILVLFCAAALNFDVENGIFEYSDDETSGSSTTASTDETSDTSTDTSGDTDTDKKEVSYMPKTYLDSVYVTEKGTLMPEMSIDDLWKHDNRYKTYLSNKNQLAYLLNAQLVSQYPYIYTEGTDEEEKDTDVTYADLNGTIKFYRNGSTDFMKYASAEQLEDYIAGYNVSGNEEDLKNAISHFTLGDNGSIVIAYLYYEKQTVRTSDYNAAQQAVASYGSNITEKDGYYYVEVEVTYLDTKTIEYRSLVQNYAIQFELLWAIVVASNDGNQAIGDAEDFVRAIASMAYDGDTELEIDDNEETFISNKNSSYAYQEEIDYTNIKYKIDGVEGNIDPIQIKGDKINHSKEEITIEKTQNPTLKVRKIESWCATYKATLKYSDDSNYNETTDDSQKDKIDYDESDKVEEKTWLYHDPQQYVNIPVQIVSAVEKDIEDQIEKTASTSNPITLSEEEDPKSYISATRIEKNGNVDLTSTTVTSDKVTSSSTSAISTSTSTVTADTSGWKQVANKDGVTTCYVGDGSAMEGSAYNALGGKLEDGMCAIDTSVFSYKDVIYIETQTDGEGSFANGRYFWACDTGGAIKGHHIDVYAPNTTASRANSAPYGTYKSSSYYVVESGVSWEEFQAKYANSSSVTTSSYSNSSTITPSFNTDLVDLFKTSSFSGVKRYLTKDSYSDFMYIIQHNTTTSNMADLINYIFNQVTGTEDYGKNLDWNNIWTALYGNLDATSSGYIIKTDETGALPEVTKEQLQSAIKVLPSKMQSNASSLIDTLIEMQSTYKVNAIFMMAMPIQETSLGTNSNYGYNWYSWFSGDTFSSGAECAKAVAKGIATNSYYFTQGNYTVESIGKIYCPDSDVAGQSEGWISGVTGFMDQMYKAIGVDITQYLSSGGSFGSVDDADLNELMSMTDAQVWQKLTGTAYTSKPSLRQVSKSVMDSRVTNISVKIRTGANSSKMQSMTVNKALASLFTAFFNDLYNQCTDFYIITYDGAYYYRGSTSGSGASAHAFGAAIDINASVKGNGYSDTPYTKAQWSKLTNAKVKNSTIYIGSPMIEIAHKYTIANGADWRRPHDAMHFSFIGDKTRAEIKKLVGK